MNKQQIAVIDSYRFAMVFFIATQMVILSSLAFSTTTQVLLLWSCNNFCFFLAYACYKQDMQMLMGVSYLGLLAQLLWASDFLLHLVGINFSTISDYVFIEGFTYANDVSIGLHLIVPMVILFFSFTTKPTVRSLLYAGGYSILLYVASLLLSAPVDDVNCIFAGCSMGGFFSYHVYQWPLYAGVAIGLGYLFHLILFFLYRSVRTRPTSLL